jgi:hypothetical protein
MIDVRGKYTGTGAGDGNDGVLAAEEATVLMASMR